MPQRLAFPNYTEEDLAAELGFKGDAVIIDHLTQRSDLNGKTGELLEFATGRWGVKVSAKESVRVRPDNLVTTKDNAVNKAMREVFPDLWDGELLRQTCTLSTPLFVDGVEHPNVPLDRQLPLDPNETQHYVGGHVLELQDGRLTWMMTTVEDCRVKWSMCAYFLVHGGRLHLILFKVNAYLAGIKVNRRSEQLKMIDAYNYLAELLTEKGSAITMPLSMVELSLHEENMILMMRNMSDQAAHPEKYWDLPPEAEDADDVMAYETAKELVDHSNVDIYKELPRPPSRLVPVTRDFMMGEVVNGAIFMHMPNSRPPQQPIYLVHRLTISDADRGAGEAERVLLSTFPDCHEPDFFTIVETVKEIRKKDPACWVDLSEKDVLGLFFQQTGDTPYNYGKKADAPPTVALPQYMMTTSSRVG